MLKRFFPFVAGVVLVFGLTISGVRVRAQAESQGEGHRHHGQAMNPDQQLDRMTKVLNLTDDQKNQIKPILEDRHEKMQSIRSDTSLSREDRMSKMRSAFEDSNNKIRAVLNDQQKQKFDQIQQRRQERMERRSQGENK